MSADTSIFPETKIFVVSHRIHSEEDLTASVVDQLEEEVVAEEVEAVVPFHLESIQLVHLSFAALPSFSSIFFSNIGAQKILVVENIPEESANAEVIMEYFSRFGQLVNSQIDVESKSAMLEYATPEEAKACHNSPEAIFNNRFVKVYWSGMENIPPPPVVLSPEELRANLRRMQEKKLEADLAVLEKQRQITEIQKNRTALISKLMAEQTGIMDKLKTDATLSVQERAVLMKGLETMQESIKSLMKETANTSQVGKPGGHSGFRGGFQQPRPSYSGPSYRPPVYQKPLNSERKFVMDPNASPFVPAAAAVPVNDAVYQTKKQAYEQLETMVCLSCSLGFMLVLLFVCFCRSRNWAIKPTLRSCRKWEI